MPDQPNDGYHEKPPPTISATSTIPSVEANVPMRSDSEVRPAFDTRQSLADTGLSGYMVLLIAIAVILVVLGTTTLLTARRLREGRPGLR